MRNKGYILIELLFSLIVLGTMVDLMIKVIQL